MIDTLQSLLLELGTVDEGLLVNLKTEERGIMVRTSAWVCRLAYPFRKSSLHILLGLGG